MKSRQEWRLRRSLLSPLVVYANKRNKYSNKVVFYGFGMLRRPRFAGLSSCFVQKIYDHHVSECNQVYCVSKPSIVILKPSILYLFELIVRYMVVIGQITWRSCKQILKSFIHRHLYSFTTKIYINRYIVYIYRNKFGLWYSRCDFWSEFYIL